MTQVSKPHQHGYCLYKIKEYYDHQKGCMVRNGTFRCVCGKEYHERYEYKPPPKKEKQCKTLEKNKKKYSNRR